MSGRFPLGKNVDVPMNFVDLFGHVSIAGAATLLVLLICSFVMIALSWELRQRWANSRLSGDWLLAQLRHLLYTSPTPPEQVETYLNSLGRPLARILKELLCEEHPTLERGDYLLAHLVERERLGLENGLSGLGTIAVIAPFVGLFGTVIGITKTFADVANQGKAGIEVVSAGVSEALVATAFGLLVAIVSVVLFNYFKAHFEQEISSWEVTGRTLLSVLTSPDPASNKLLDERVREQTTRSAESFLESLQPPKP